MVYVEEISETNFAELNSAIRDAIIRSGFDWTRDEEKFAPEQYTMRQQRKVLEVARSLLRKIIPNNIRMGLSDHGLSHTLEKIIQDV